MSAMPMKGGESSYVAQFWPELAKITGAQVPAAPSSFLGTPGPAREFGKRQFGPNAPQPELGVPQRPNPVAAPQSSLEEAVSTQAVPSIGTRANPPSNEESGDEFGFWKIANQMSEEDKQKILKDYEYAGVDVEAGYKELAEMGEIDAGMIKKGKDGKLDKKDMGLFLMEFGLRQMAGGGKGKDFGSVIGEAALGTMDVRRVRHAKSMEDKESELDRAYKRSQDERDRKDKGLSAVEREQSRRTEIATKQADLADRAQGRRDAEDLRTFEAGQRSLDRGADRQSREEIATENRLGRQEEIKLRNTEISNNKQHMRDKEVAEMTAKHIQQVRDSYTAKVLGDKTWRQMTPEEKDQYEQDYAQKVRRAFGPIDAPAWTK